MPSGKRVQKEVTFSLESFKQYVETYIRLYGAIGDDRDINIKEIVVGKESVIISFDETKEERMVSFKLNDEKRIKEKT